MARVHQNEELRDNLYLVLVAITRMSLGERENIGVNLTLLYSEHTYVDYLVLPNRLAFWLRGHVEPGARECATAEARDRQQQATSHHPIAGILQKRSAKFVRDLLCI